MFLPLPLLLATLLAAMPVATMTVGGGSALFYVILLICLVQCTVRPGGWRETLHSLARYKAVIGALTVPLVAILLSQAAHDSVHGPSLERGLRISLAFPIILGAMLSVNPKQLRLSFWGVAAAGWVSAAIVFWLIFPALNRPPTPQSNAVTYGNLMLLWLVLTLYSLPLTLTSRPRLEKQFKVLTAVLTFAGFVFTQTRTGWMAIPLFLLIALWLFGKLRHPVKALGLLAAGLVVLIALGATNEALRERVAQGVHEVQECRGDNATADTSVCIRLQLWRASLQMIEAEPYFGLGSPARFIPELEARVSTGVVSPFVAEGFGEPHNDMLHMLTSYGPLGGLGLVLLYGAPACIYFRRLAAKNPTTTRVAAAMGLALSLGFAIFGLTELMFRSMHNLSLYVTLTAWLLALSHPTSDRSSGSDTMKAPS